MWCFEGASWLGFGGWWMILFFGALIGLISWAIISITRRGVSELVPNHVEIAKERYAKGEISKEEYEQIKKTLS